MPASPHGSIDIPIYIFALSDSEYIVVPTWLFLCLLFPAVPLGGRGTSVCKLSSPEPDTVQSMHLQAPRLHL